MDTLWSVFKSLWSVLPRWSDTEMCGLAVYNCQDAQSLWTPCQEQDGGLHGRENQEGGLHGAHLVTAEVGEAIGDAGAGVICSRTEDCQQQRS